jgi:hypothetical protein
MSMMKPFDDALLHADAQLGSAFKYNAPLGMTAASLITQHLEQGLHLGQ